MLKIIKTHVKEFIVNKASDHHSATLIKIELFHRYFSRILATDAKQLQWDLHKVDGSGAKKVATL